MLKEFNIDKIQQDDDLDTFLRLFLPVIYADEEEKEEKVSPIKKTIQVHKYIKDGSDKFIDKLCVDACNILWDKNIYTKAVVVDDEKVCIVLHTLDAKNQLEFEIQSCYDSEKYYMEDGSYQIKVYKENKKDEQIKKELKEAVKFFVIQDVEGGYLTKDKFLMTICHCGKVDGMKEYEPKLNLEINFDKNKMEKSFDEYLKEKNYEHLYVKEEERVYLDDYYLKGHKKYLQSLK